MYPFIDKRNLTKEERYEIEYRNGLFELSAELISIYEEKIISNETTLSEKIDILYALRDFFNSEIFDTLHPYLRCGRNYSCYELYRICICRICNKALSINALEIHSNNNKKVCEQCKFNIKAITKYLIDNKLKSKEDLLYYITLCQN